MIKNTKLEPVESFILKVYEGIGVWASQKWGSTAYMPTSYTREFHLRQSFLEPSVPIPSIFYPEDVKKVIADIPEQEYGDYKRLDYAFIIQFCWKEPEKIHGFFKIRPKYPYGTDEALFKTKPIPMALTEDIDLDFTEDNKQRIINGLIHIMETI